VIVVVVALMLLAVVAAAEAGVLSASRARLSKMNGRGGPRARRLYNYVEERASALGALSVARNLAVVLATAFTLFLVVRAVNDGWGVLIVVALAVVLVLALVDALPRLMVARSPETWGMRIVPVVSLFRRIFGPVAWAIDRSLRTVVPRDEQPAGEEEEVLRRAEIENGGEEIEEDERQMIRGVMELEETTAREIMAPRIDIAAVPQDGTIDDALNVIVEKGFSRVPIYEETIDNVTGIVYAKDILRCIREGRRPALLEIARPPYFIPEAKRVDELLAELRQSKVHIAIVVDEYGGTAGLVTIEDLLEEIVGEIQDEYDREEVPIERVTATEAILDARVSLDALHELFDFEVDEEEQDYDTVGGFVYHHLGKVPIAGDEVRVDGLTLRVLSVIGRRIKKVRATKASQDAAIAG
jgi:putative hemolysin